MTSAAWPRRAGLTQPMVVAIVIAVVAGIVVVAFVLQSRAERGALSPITGGTSVLDQRQIDKLNAEIRQIRSDTTGSLFWLKMAGVFVTVGAAVGGYLIGQTRTTRERAEADRHISELQQSFELRQNVDAMYDAYVQELASPSPLVRVASAMKLGMNLLQSPPREWSLSAERRRELGELTKQILASSLAIEKDAKVLKALSIAIAMHPKESDAAELRELDFSGATAADAYWARIDFTYSDFYRADLTNASFRKATLNGVQFREATLREAVLAGAVCGGTNFKLSDLRGADLSGADLRKAAFEDVKVFGVNLAGIQFGENPEGRVDVSSAGDGSQQMDVATWLAGGAR